MSNSEITLGDFFDLELSGDWGEEIKTIEFSKKVKCIRGADLNNIYSGDISSSPIRYIKNSNLKNKKLYEDDIVIEISGGSPTQSTGRTVIITDKIIKSTKLPLISSNFCRALRVKKEYNPCFVFYLMQNLYKSNIFFNFEGKTTGIKNLDLQSCFRNIKAKRIKKSSQNKIASLLSTLDSKIVINNQINYKLESLTKVLYDYWFGQFDFPNKYGKPYKTFGGKMIWNKILKKKIPKGWEVHKIGDLLETSLGGTPSTKVKDYWENGKYHWLNSGEIANFPVIDSELKITEEAIRNSSTKLLPKGSTLLSITRHLRPTILAIDACVNQSVVGIKENNIIKHCFLYPYLRNEIPRLLTMRSGAQQPHINKEIVDDSLILIPNQESNILKKYNLEVEHFYELIINNSLQNKKLSELRDWLLPMLMNGQVRVK